MTNRQYVIRQFANDLLQATTIVNTPLPELGPNQVLICHRYVGINALYDRELYRGRVPYIQVQFPYVFGVEAVGEIVAVGADVEGLKVGQAVGTVKVGTAYQQYQVIEAGAVVPIPEATAEYLTLSPTGVSAYLALEKVAMPKQGETAVVSAAAGGLGHILVQLLKRQGCRVVAICGSTEKVNMLQQLACCDRIINYREEDLPTVLQSEYGRQIDIAIDSVGRQVFDAFVPNLAPLGRLVVCGLAAELSDQQFEQITAPRIYEQLYWKGASVRCFMNHLYRDDHARVRNLLFDLYQEEQLQVCVDETSFQGIEGIAEASQYLLAGRSCGKVVVEV